VRYAGGNCVLLESDESQGFRVTAEMVAQLITPRTKVIILNSPSNPSGAVMSAEDMTEVIRLAHQRGIWVLSDECYVYLNYAGKNFSVGALREYALEDIRDDGMAARICHGSVGGGQCDGETAEPVDVESDFDCAESCRGCAKGAARVR
jgi:DNA-binding transcriptional MocR family regulator